MSDHNTEIHRDVLRIANNDDERPSFQGLVGAIAVGVDRSIPQAKRKPWQTRLQAVRNHEPRMLEYESGAPRRHGGWRETGHATRPSWGMADGKALMWCVTCAKANHPAAVSKKKICEDCGVKVPSWGMVDGERYMWCGACATANHSGAVRGYDLEAKRKKNKKHG